MDNIKINLLIMNFMGLWPTGDTSYKPGFYMLYTTVIVILVASHILSEVINIYFVRDNLEMVVGIIYIILIEIMAATKAVIVIRKMKTLKNTVKLIQSDWFQPQNNTQILLIQPSINFWKLIYKVFVTASIGCNIFWMIPLLSSSTMKKQLPFLAWYPYDAAVSPLYEITYVFQLVSTGYLTFISINVDALICVFNVYSCCQFDLLSDNLRNLEFINDNPCETRASLIWCITHHEQILRFVKSCNDFFKWILFWHLIVSGVSIGITMFQLTLSNFVSYATFESDWINFPHSTKKDLLLFSMNLTRPLTISTFNVFQLSLNTFVKILKTAWSYFALLYQLSGKS
ncbi:odorant receptor 49b-like [Zophobas morio]|uniref:odorant receptor 49b-like n=1 Tax=Zophobas morio TaxID=2755281 RepID=UPI00308316B7